MFTSLLLWSFICVSIGFLFVCLFVCLFVSVCPQPYLCVGMLFFSCAYFFFFCTTNCYRRDFLPTDQFGNHSMKYIIIIYYMVNKYEKKKQFLLLPLFFFFFCILIWGIERKSQQQQKWTTKYICKEQILCRVIVKNKKKKTNRHIYTIAYLSLIMQKKQSYNYIISPPFLSLSQKKRKYIFILNVQL